MRRLLPRQHAAGPLGGNHAALREHALVDGEMAAVLRVRSPHLGISRSNEAEHAGHDVQVLAEVLT